MRKILQHIRRLRPGSSPVSTGCTQADELLPVTEAFRYVVSDTGDAFEIDWAIDDALYLYAAGCRSRAAPTRSFSASRSCPRAWITKTSSSASSKSTETFLRRIPYTVNGERPRTADLIIKSQGCDDNIGLCYPPQTWTETVSSANAAAAKPKLQLGSLGSNVRQ